MPQRGARAPASHVEPEVEDVAVLDGVVLALEPQLAGIARARLAVQRDIVVVGDGLGADEALLEVGVDHAGRLRRAGLAPYRPGARLLRPDGEEGDEVEQGVAGSQDPREAGFLQPERGEVFALVLERKL